MKKTHRYIGLKITTFTEPKKKLEGKERNPRGGEQGDSID